MKNKDFFKNLTKGSVAKKVITKIIISMVLVNFMAIVVLGNFMRESVGESEEKYLTEIVANVSSTIDITMKEYMDICEVITENTLIKELFYVSDAENRMYTMPESEAVLKEMVKITEKFEGAILNLGVLDIEEDGYLLHNGVYSGDSFSFKTRPYYSAVTNRETIITSPYIDDSTGGMVVSICSPVMDDYNNIIGAILIDISIDFMAELIINSSYGETGDSLVIDENNIILAFEDMSMIGDDISKLGISDNDFNAQIAKPTGELIEFEIGGIKKIGSIGEIGDLNWKMITGIGIDEFNEPADYVIDSLIIILVLSTLTTLINATYSISKSLAPIKNINVAMKNMAEGNLHCDLEFSSNDEIGELSQNIRNTSENLSMYINEIEGQLMEFGEGNFIMRTDVEFIGDFKNIQYSIAQFVDLITTTLLDLKATINQVSIGSGQVASGSQNLAQGSEEQAGGIYKLNEFIKDITISINENAKNANHINETANTIISELKESNDKMNNMLISMNEINEQSEEIKKIVATIEDIASQTNILSLNASVEAARAGQAGGGFAVVANEVRSLASRTSIAVQNTAQLIDSTTLAISEGNLLADETARSLQSVTNDINAFIGNIEEISVATQQQASALDEINKEINQISTVMEVNSTFSQESAATAQELSSQAVIMKNTVDNFKM